MFLLLLFLLKELINCTSVIKAQVNCVCNYQEKCKQLVVFARVLVLCKSYYTKLSMTTKQYLRFAPSSVFGIIGSSSARIRHLCHEKKFNSVAVPACEDVVLWNLQTKEKVCLFLHIKIRLN